MGTRKHPRSTQTGGNTPLLGGGGTTGHAKEKPWWGEHAALIESDPPRHNQIKAQVLQVYNPRASTELGTVFRTQTEDLLADVLKQDSFDGHTEIAAA